MAAKDRRALPLGVEWEFRSVILDRRLSRNVVRKVLVEHAERGGWELDRIRIGNDGVRRIKLRRKIIRQRREEIFV